MSLVIVIESAVGKNVSLIRDDSTKRRASNHNPLRVLLVCSLPTVCPWKQTGAFRVCNPPFSDEECVPWVRDVVWCSEGRSWMLPHVLQSSQPRNVQGCHVLLKGEHHLFQGHNSFKFDWKYVTFVFIYIQFVLQVYIRIDPNMKAIITEPKAPIPRLLTPSFGLAFCK